MMIKKAMLAGGAAFAALVMASPASAAIYIYDMKDGSKLTVNTDTKSGTWIGTNLNATFTSDDFANFTGGAAPKFTATLGDLSGYLIRNGQKLAPNPKNKFTTHLQQLKFEGGGKVNLWAQWGDPIQRGDYIKYIGSVSSSGGTPVSEPGMLGLFALGMMGLWAGNRRRRVTVKGLRPATA